MLKILRRRERSRGFTLIELLVVVIVIGILAAIAVPNFIGTQDNARNASTKANMRMTQMAAESFATDNGGTYSFDAPTGANPISTYFPGGNSGGGTAGNPPVNPFTNEAVWTIFMGIDIADVTAERAKAPSAAIMAGDNPGRIGYARIGVSPTGFNAVSYGIEGTDAARNAIAGSAPNTTLVLSNL